MKVIAYLGFTLLSIVIQFSVMDLTQEEANIEDVQINHNFTSQKKTFEEILQSITQKPHALYYRMSSNDKIKNVHVIATAKTYSDIAQATEISSTILDEIYDEDVATTEDSFTTESLDFTTEYDNVTEINFFEKKNQSNVNLIVPKKNVNQDCSCNLLFQVCDINCCCDSDCLESEIQMFVGCKVHQKSFQESHSLCYPYQYFSAEGQNNMINNLFCITKINLPDKKNKSPKKHDLTSISYTYKWHRLASQSKYTEFQRKPYLFGEHVWVLKEGALWYIDIPSLTVNNYCSGRTPIQFLNNMNVKCIVNVKDLEMFQIIKTIQEAPCISVTEKSLNTTALNCTTLQCTNWTIKMCEDNNCVIYNKSLHEPSCTDGYCKNFALKLEYLLQYYNSKIINATIKLYTQNISTDVSYMTQEVIVRFLLTNETVDRIIEISGNPGYNYGYPVIVSSNQSNRSASFFDSSARDEKYLSHVHNKNGVCQFSKTENHYILFGSNKRIKCRYIYDKYNIIQNSSVCNEISNQIASIFQLADKMYVSPLGNPLDVKDAHWLHLHTNFNEIELPYGQIVANKSKLRCYNIVNRVSYIFSHTDVSEKTSKKVNKILSANASAFINNFTFTPEDISIVLTIDISFIDLTKSKIYEYAAGPYIDVNLPKDFFFPFRSNGSRAFEYCGVFLIFIYAVYFQIK